MLSFIWRDSSSTDSLKCIRTEQEFSGKGPNMQRNQSSGRSYLSRSKRTEGNNKAAGSGSGSDRTFSLVQQIFSAEPGTDSSSDPEEKLLRPEPEHKEGPTHHPAASTGSNSRDLLSMRTTKTFFSCLPKLYSCHGR